MVENQVLTERKTVAFQTLGCRLNFSETSSVRQRFLDRSFDVVDFDAHADIYVINTCSVTQDANSDCRRIVRKALKQNPNAFVAVMGCYAQLEPEEIAAIDGVDVVLGAKEKFDLFDLVDSFEKKDSAIIYRTDVNAAVDFHHAFSSSDRTRAFLKIQDGCDYKCAFCTIPLARGKSRSPLISDVLKNAVSLVAQGFREMVLTGVNAGDFGRYNGETFYQLLKALEHESGIERIRISSIEPNLLEDDIIAMFAESTVFQPHFHLPLQSGSDEILRLMRRRYKKDLYAHKVSLIRKLIPHAAIGTDVITGHPGETREHFQETVDFLQELEVSYLHVFTYSERPNTKALEYEPIVPIPERKKRTQVLRSISNAKRFQFDTQFAESTRPVLFESYAGEGTISGWTDNYIRVKMPFSQDLENTIVPVLLHTYRESEQVFMGRKA
jgi:threonylcarbamoyladenosine tRNA methylthiotransferase MtaB